MTLEASPGLPPRTTAVILVFFRMFSYSVPALSFAPLTTASIAACTFVLLLVVSNFTYIARPYDTFET